MKSAHSRIAAIALLQIALASCSDVKQSIESPPANYLKGLIDDGRELVPYPLGHWRLVSESSLENVVLWVSHILIRHEGSDMVVPATVHEWVLDTPPPTRQRTEALAIAKAVAIEAKAEPARFAYLASRYSEDSTTAANGGSLGGIRAIDLILDPPILDALAAIKPGEVSRVVETQHGFHILYRHAPPAESQVSGAHIVIGHLQTRWLSSIGGPLSRRTHDEAITLADQIYAEARRRPDAFRDLVRKYSDHPDKAMGGDIGTWSVREQTYLPRAIARLRTMKPGDVARPFESHMGVEIIQRTPDRQRNRYAMEAIMIAFEPGNDASKRWAMSRAAELTQTLTTRPDLFDAFRRSYCCPGIETWIEGREEPGLSSAIARLAVGEIGQPLEQFLNVVIPRRVEPHSHSLRPNFELELPAPDVADFDELLPRIPRRVLVRELASVAAELEGNLEVNDEQQRILRELEHNVDRRSSCTDDILSQRDFMLMVDALLRGDRTSEFRQRIAQRLTDRILRSRRVPVSSESLSVNQPAVAR